MTYLLKIDYLLNKIFVLQLNELVLATLEGDLAVFKCSQTTVWAQSSQLGMVSIMRSIINYFNYFLT
jgi:uncharacterized membrane protein